MLEIINASCGYQKRTETKTVLENFNLTLEKGQLMCLLGANGAGKTTVFKTILGSLPLLAGGILIDGTPISQMDQKTRASKIAYVPQQHTPPFPYTVLQVVEMGRCIHVSSFASPTPADTRKAEETLCRLGIGHLKDAVYTELSGGERQLVLIARALAQEAEYLLLDEPTASLDYGNQIRLLREIRNLADGGIGVCMILHDPKQALLLDRDVTVILDKGRTLRGKARQVITPQLLEELYHVQAELKSWTDAAGNPVRSIHTHL